MADPAKLLETVFAAIAARDVDALQATHHENLVEDFVVLGPITGRSEIREFFSEMFAAMPQLRFATENIMQVDERTAVGQWLLEGTFNGGPFMGIEPTGKSISLRGIDVMVFEDDLLVHNTIYYDGLQFARQIGLLPPEGSKRDKTLTRSFNAFTKTKNKLSRG